VKNINCEETNLNLVMKHCSLVSVHQHLTGTYCLLVLTNYKASDYAMFVIVLLVPLSQI